MAMISRAVWMFAIVAAFAAVVVAAEGAASSRRDEDRNELNYGVELSPAEREIRLTDGLSDGFYDQTCPTVQSIVDASVAASLEADIGTAPGIVRLAFHDCFVQGCDGSVLLNLTSGTELTAIPNLTIRKVALDLVADIKAQTEAVCPGIVSCADIIALAAAEAVWQVGGPSITVPLGRRDSLNFSSTVNLPSPFDNFTAQSAEFAAKNLTTTDLVALAGAHTLGVAHCGTFVNRLLPTVDPTLNASYAAFLIANICPTNTSAGNTSLDFFTPNEFDNQYFAGLPLGLGLMTSDESLTTNTDAFNLVLAWAANQSAFFEQFPISFIKMTQIQVLTGTAGEIRKVCNTTNSGNSVFDSIPVPEDMDTPELISMVTNGWSDS